MNDTVAPAADTPQYTSCIQRLGYLETCLLSNDPQMKEHLKEIHKLLISYDELVHLLSDDEIAKIMAAQQIVTNQVLIGSTTSASKKATVTKKAAGLSLGDL